LALAAFGSIAAVLENPVFEIVLFGATSSKTIASTGEIDFAVE
jgi:hypothetical protein